MAVGSLWLLLGPVNTTEMTPVEPQKPSI